MNQDAITKQWYIELQVFGDTKKTDIINSWNIISEMQKRLTDYKSPKSKIRSKIYDELADKNIQGLMREIDNKSTELISDKEYDKIKKKLKIQERRRRKYYKL